MTDTKKLKELAERARDKGDWYKASSVDAFPEFHVDQEFMVATSPDVVLWLIAEIERLNALLKAAQRTDEAIDSVLNIEQRNERPHTTRTGGAGGWLYRVWILPGR